jgi:hypothetical protein
LSDFSWIYRKINTEPKQYFPKRLLTFTELQGVISQQIEVFIVTTVRISNPMYSYICRIFRAFIGKYIQNPNKILNCNGRNAWRYFVDKTEKRRKIKLSTCVGTDQILGPTPSTMIRVRVEYGLQENQFSPDDMQSCVDPFYIAERDIAVLTKGSENALPPPTLNL